MPKVFNKHHGNAPADAVYIGRPSKWGNPFAIGPNCTRQQAVSLFRESLSPEFKKQIQQELRGRNLLCFCSPNLCHGDVLLEIANASVKNYTEKIMTERSSRTRSSSKTPSHSQPETLVTESLAVKYRPRVLEDLVGQDHIVAEIKGMFTKRRIPSSIMLAGPTGLGKTTVARILARYINCTNRDAETFQPCGTCPNCMMQEHPDVLELNAADTRGIDDVRKLIEQSRNMPSMGIKRLFIIDEAQQLTPQAQQAILRPIEEPPKGTMWIICTMSPDKVLPAIAGRCTKLFVRPVEPEVAVQRLYRIARKEGIDFKKMDGGSDILKTVADFSNGHMRDAVALLDKVIFTMAGKKDLDPKTVIQAYLSSGEGNLDDMAVDVLIAILSKDVKLLLKSAQTCDNPRGVLNKMRWLIDYLLSNAIGAAKFTPYSGRLFATKIKKSEIRVSLSTLIRVQALLVNIEVRLNSMSIDERVVFVSMIGDFVVGLEK